MRTLLRELVWSFILVIVLSAVSSLGVERVRVDGMSMAPTLESGQHLLANKLPYSGIAPRVFASIDHQQEEVLPARGDIIIFHPPARDGHVYVKRVIGLPGETIELREGTVYVNGAPLVEPYVTYRDWATMPPAQVPAGHVFVLGDNRPVSSDSRSWGPVPLQSIEGVAWLRYWPLHLASPLPLGGQAP